MVNDKTKCCRYAPLFYFEEEGGAWVDFHQPKAVIEHAGKACRAVVDNGENDPFVFSISQFQSVDSFKKHGKCLCIKTPESLNEEKEEDGKEVENVSSPYSGFDFAHSKVPSMASMCMCCLSPLFILLDFPSLTEAFTMRTPLPYPPTHSLSEIVMPLEYVGFGQPQINYVLGNHYLGKAELLTTL